MRKTLAYAAIAVLLFLGVVEAGVRAWEAWAGAPAPAHRYYVPCADGPPGDLCTDPRFLASAESQGGGMTFQRFPAVKPPGASRTFLAGGSFMLALGAALERETPPEARGAPGQVVTAAGNGYDSTRVVDVVREAAGYAPDLVLAATGNNEFITRDVLFLREARGFLDRHVRAYGILRRAAIRVRRAAGGRDEVMLFTADGALVTTPLVHAASPPVDGPLREAAFARFRGNLEAVARAVPPGRLVLLTLPINERFPPYFFARPRPAAAGGFAAYQRALMDAYRALRDGDAGPALAGFRAAYGAYRDPAVTAYLDAIAAEAGGRTDEAKALYPRVQETTAYPVQTTRAQNQWARETAARHGARLVDLERLFRDRAAAAGRAFPDDLFADNCHANAAGTRIVVEAVEGVLPARRR